MIFMTFNPAIYGPLGIITGLLIIAIYKYLGFDRGSHPFGYEKLDYMQYKPLEGSQSSNPKSKGEIWREARIKDPTPQKESNKISNTMHVRAGEFGKRLRNSVRQGILNGLDIKVQAKEPSPNDKELVDDLIELFALASEKGVKFEFLPLPTRPEDHFTVIRERDVYLEYFHPPNKPERESVGQKMAHQNFLTRYLDIFEAEWEKCREKAIDVITNQNYSSAMEKYKVQCA